MQKKNTTLKTFIYFIHNFKFGEIHFVFYLFINTVKNPSNFFNRIFPINLDPLAVTQIVIFVFTQISYSVFCIGTSTAWQHTNSHQQGKSRWSITCQNRITTAYITYGNKVGPRNNWQHRTQSIGHHHRPKQKDQCNQERNLTTTAGCHQTEVGEVKRNLILERSSRITDKNSEL